MGIFNWLRRWKKPKKITLGLALGSGGAKGYATLGILKAFEEKGLKFDVVAGTSIGSIIGAFYAQNYSCTDIFELLKRIDFGDVLSKFIIGTDTQGLYNVLDRELGGKNIEELSKPFMTVATHLESGEEKVFSSGDTAKALCASSAIPPFFKPVVIDNERYIDGAFVNSIPADLVKKMGADYVVGIDLSTRESKPSIIEKLIPTYQSKVLEPWKKGYDNSDIVLHPDLTGYKSYSLNGGDQMFDIGYALGREKADEILSQIQKLKFGKNK